MRPGIRQCKSMIPTGRWTGTSALRLPFRHRRRRPGSGPRNRPLPPHRTTTPTDRPPCRCAPQRRNRHRHRRCRSGPGSRPLLPHRPTTPTGRRPCRCAPQRRSRRRYRPCQSGSPRRRPRSRTVPTRPGRHRSSSRSCRIPTAVPGCTSRAAGRCFPSTRAQSRCNPGRGRPRLRTSCPGFRPGRHLPNHSSRRSWPASSLRADRWPSSRRRRPCCHRRTLRPDPPRRWRTASGPVDSPTGNHRRPRCCRHHTPPPDPRPRPRSLSGRGRSRPGPWRCRRRHHHPGRCAWGPEHNPTTTPRPP